MVLLAIVFKISIIKRYNFVLFSFYANYSINGNGLGVFLRGTVMAEFSNELSFLVELGTSDSTSPVPVQYQHQ